MKHFYKIIVIIGLHLIFFDVNAQPDDGIASLEKAFTSLSENSTDPLSKAELADKLTLEYISNNDLEEALHYNSVSERLKEGSDEVAFIPNYRHLGLIYTRMRHFPRAKLYLEKAFRLALDENDQLNQARLYADQGDWCFRVGDFDEAVSFYFDAKQIFESLEDQDVNLAFVRMALGATYFENGSPGRASIEYETAREILVAKLGEKTKTLIPLYTGEGKSLMAYGDFPLAESRLIRALELAGEHYGKNHPETAKALVNLAILELKLGKTSQAEYFTRLASDILATKQEAFAERRIFQDQLLRLKHVNAYILLNQYLELPDESYLVAADSVIKEGLDVLDSALQGFSLELDRMNFVRSHQQLYDMALTIEKARLNTNTSKEEIAETAFETIERNKAQVLNSLIHDVQVKEISGIPANLVDQEKALKDKLNHLRAERALAESGSPLYARLSEELLGNENRYEDFVRKLEKEYPQYYKLRYQKNRISLKKIQSVLGESDALISYYLENDVYHIFYLDADIVEWLTFDKDIIFEGQEAFKQESKFKVFNKTIFGKKKAPEIETVPVPTKIIESQPSYPLDDAIRFYTKSIRKFEKELFITSSRSLYEKLIYPVANRIRQKKHLVIIPDGELHYIPFEALLSKAIQEGKSVKYSKLPYLVKDFSISYHHSASLFYETRIIEKQYSKAFMGFDPVFNDSLRNGWIWSSKDYLRDTAYYTDYSNLRSISHSGKRKFKELKYSKEEVVSIAKLFARSESEAEVFLHAEASESNFKSRSGAAGIVHVASHSFVDYANPEASGLAFAINDKGINDDGILYAPETFNLDLSADLLVLSSCESGVGKIAKGEGLLSLTRGFIFSGAKNAVVSLWRISDRTTSRFMIDFYRSMITEERPYPKALRAAKLKSINNEKTAAPRYWSSFILIGK